MKENNIFKLMLSVILASMLLAAFFVPQQSVQAKSELVGFTFTNNSDRLASLRLYGNGQFYYFLLFPGESKYYTPVRGEYDMTFYSCGQYVNREIDLTKIKTLVVPACGTVAYNNTFENETDNYMKAILQGPATYVFSFAKDQEKTYTISKGEYTYTLYGCGGSFSKTFHATQDKVVTFKCP